MIPVFADFSLFHGDASNYFNVNKFRRWRTSIKGVSFELCQFFAVHVLFYVMDGYPISFVSKFHSFRSLDVNLMIIRCSLLFNGFYSIVVSLYLILKMMIIAACGSPYNFPFYFVLKKFSRRYILNFFSVSAWIYLVLFVLFIFVNFFLFYLLLMEAKYIFFNIFSYKWFIFKKRGERIQRDIKTLVENKMTTLG